MPLVFVYSQPRCVQCDATKRFLTQRGVSFIEVRVDQDPEALERVRTLGYTSAPVVIVGDEHWSGFRMERLQELVKVA